MPFELLHFRGSDDILKDKGMENDLQRTLEYLDNVLYGSIHRRELLREALEEMGWRRKRDLSILPGRRYYYKGIKQRVAIEGNFALYEYILEGLFRLQIGHQKETIDMGILLLTGQRGEKTPYGSTRKLVEEEVQDLYPIIDLPVTICLFDLGKPGESMEEEVKDQTKESAGEPEKAPEETKVEGQKSPESIPPTKKSRSRKKVLPKSPSLN